MKILHDIHTHNIFSSCCMDTGASTEAYINKEKELGMKVFGLSNHVWDERIAGASRWYSTQRIANAKEAKCALEKADSSIRTLFGAEGEYYGCKDILGMSAEGAAEFDYVLIPFSHLHIRNDVMLDFPEIIEARNKIRADMKSKLPYLTDSHIDAMLRPLHEAEIMKIYPDLKIDMKPYLQKSMMENFFGLIEHPEFEKIARTVPTVVAHAFAFCGYDGPTRRDLVDGLPLDKIAEGYKKLANMGVYIELNVGEIKGINSDLPNNNLLQLYKIAKEMGCKFTFGSDSHCLKGLDIIKFGDAIAEEMKLTKADIAEFVRDGVEE